MEKFFSSFLIISNKPLAYDLNLTKVSDIYIKMRIDEYFKGFTKKILAQIYTNYGNNILKTMFNFLKSTAGLRVMFHFVNTLILVISLIMLIMNVKVILGITFLLLYILATSAYLIKLRLTRCKNFSSVVMNFLKFRIYSFLTLSLMPFYILKYNDKFKEIYGEIKRLNQVVFT